MKNLKTVVRNPAVRTFLYMWTATVVSGVHLIVDIERAKRLHNATIID